MIYVDRGLVEEPQILRDADGPTAKERERAREHFAHTPQAKFDFLAYRNQEVRDALERLFHGKCAYCESPYAAVHTMDIDHWRPKSEVVAEGRSRRPGYWWLASEWTNLFPSCTHCNRRQRHFVKGKRTMLGKGTLFPLVAEAYRASAPLEESLETPLLLNPCADRPEHALDFDLSGWVESRKSKDVRNEKGVASIIGYGLLRSGLVKARREHARIVEIQFRRLLKAHAEGSPTEDEWKLLLEYVEPWSPYAGMARNLIRGWIVEHRLTGKPPSQDPPKRSVPATMR